MPIKRVLFWQPNQGSTVSNQVLSEVSQGVEALNGIKDGRWKATLTFYKAILKDQSMVADYPRDFLGIALSEQPSKYYFVIRLQRIVLEADLSIQFIMEKLQSYRSRISLNFEGVQYQLGDFQVRVAKVVPTNHENLRGLVMEVEYLPISSTEKSRKIMDDFLEIWQEAVSKRSLPGHFIPVEPNFAEFGLGDHYTSQHKAVQYASVLAQVIANVQGGRN